VVGAGFCVLLVSAVSGVGAIEIISGAVLLRPGNAWAALPAVFVVGAVYGTLSERLFAATAGKLLMGCRVVRDRATPGGMALRLGWGAAIPRNIIKWALAPGAASDGLVHLLKRDGGGAGTVQQAGQPGNRARTDEPHLAIVEQQIAHAVTGIETERLAHGAGKGGLAARRDGRFLHGPLRTGALHVHDAPCIRNIRLAVLAGSRRPRRPITVPCAAGHRAAAAGERAESGGIAAARASAGPVAEASGSRTHGAGSGKAQAARRRGAFQKPTAWPSLRGSDPAA